MFIALIIGAAFLVLCLTFVISLCCVAKGADEQSDKILSALNERSASLGSQIEGILDAVKCRWFDQLHGHADGCPSEWSLEEAVIKAGQDARILSEKRSECYDLPGIAKHLGERVRELEDTIRCAAPFGDDNYDALDTLRRMTDTLNRERATVIRQAGDLARVSRLCRGEEVPAAADENPAVQDVRDALEEAAAMKRRAAKADTEMAKALGDLARITRLCRGEQVPAAADENQAVQDVRDALEEAAAMKRRAAKADTEMAKALGDLARITRLCRGEQVPAAADENQAVQDVRDALEEAAAMKRRAAKADTEMAKALGELAGKVAEIADALGVKKGLTATDTVTHILDGIRILQNTSTRRGLDLERLQFENASCLSIAEGRDGWDSIDARCDPSPAMLAVQKLRREYEEVKKGLFGRMAAKLNNSLANIAAMCRGEREPYDLKDPHPAVDAVRQKVTEAQVLSDVSYTRGRDLENIAKILRGDKVAAPATREHPAVALVRGALALKPWWVEERRKLHRAGLWESRGTGNAAVVQDGEMPTRRASDMAIVARDLHRIDRYEQMAFEDRY